MLGHAAVTDHRHQERSSRPLQGADDLHAGDPAVQEDQTDLEPGLAHRRE